MFKSPTGLTLGSYDRETQSSIEGFGGKFGLLERIASDEDLYRELYEKFGIVILPNLIPIIVGNNNNISQDELNRLLEQINFLHERNNGFGKQLGTGNGLLRVSAPGDFRSFVDIFPTEKVYDLSENGINSAIAGVKSKIKEIEGDIKKYAEGTGVPYSEETIRFGVVGEMDVNVITVTENPNNNDIFIDDYQGENFYGKTIFSETDNEEKTTNVGKKVRNLLRTLREKGILDKDIAYQFEFGQRYNGDLILFQVKEFCKKLPILTSVSMNFSIYVNKVLVGSYDEYVIPIIYGQTSKSGFITTRESTDNVCLALGYNTQNLTPTDYSANVVGFIHGDAHGGVLNHNSFRTAQATLQKGGFALLGNRFVDYIEGNNLQEVKVENDDGKIKVGIKMPKITISDLPLPRSI